MKMELRYMLEKFIETCNQEKKITRPNTVKMEILDMLIISIQERIHPKVETIKEIIPDKKAVDLFMDYGLNEAEATIYVYMIQMGRPVKVGDMSKTLKIERGLTYRSVDRLQTKGFISSDFTILPNYSKLASSGEDVSVKRYFAISPKYTITEDYKRNILDADQRKNMVLNNLDYLSSISNECVIEQKTVKKK